MRGSVAVFHLPPDIVVPAGTWAALPSEEKAICLRPQADKSCSEGKMEKPGEGRVRGDSSMWIKSGATLERRRIPAEYIRDSAWPGVDLGKDAFSGCDGVRDSALEHG